MSYQLDSAVHNTQWITRFCLFPMLFFADRFLVAYGQMKLSTVRTTRADHSIGRYVFVNRRRIFRTDKLVEVERAISSEPNWDPVITMFDCKTAAEQIVSRLPRTPYVFVVGVSEGKEA